MVTVLGVLVSLFLLALAVGGLTGRLRARSCCAAADPRRDLRMRAAFEDDAPASDRAS